MIIIAFMGFSFLFPEWMNHYYRNGLFRWFRIIFDPIARTIPFSNFWILIIFSLIALVKAARTALTSQLSWWLNSLGKWFSMFFVLWGFNYSASDYIELRKLKFSSEEIEIADYSKAALNIVQNISPKDLANLELELSEENALKDIRKTVESHLDKYDCPSSGKPKLVSVRQGYLMRLGISGIYFPYSFEAYVDGGLRYSEKAFVAAHEIAHAFGYTNESEANYIALKAMEESENPSFKKAAELYFFISLYSKIKREAPTEWVDLREEIPLHLMDELEAIEENWESQRNLLWNFSTISNDLYLKALGQEEGVESYSAFIDWKLKDGSFSNE